MTFIYSSPEPTKVCKKCGGTFEYKYLIADKKSKDGVRAICKPCKAIKQVDQRRRRAKREVIIAKVEIEDRKVRDDLVPPRTFNHLKDAPWDGKLEPVYIRNCGLKHIPSRGMPT